MRPMTGGRPARSRRVERVRGVPAAPERQRRGGQLDGGEGSAADLGPAGDDPGAERLPHRRAGRPRRQRWARRRTAASGSVSIRSVGISCRARSGSS